jgi:hypothetical protein
MMARRMKVYELCGVTERGPFTTRDRYGPWYSVRLWVRARTIEQAYYLAGHETAAVGDGVGVLRVSNYWEHRL